LTNTTGLPISTGISGLGTGVATALAVNTGSAGSVLVNGGVLGTPSSGTLTNATGLPISTGVSGLGTGVATFLATPTSANLASAVTDETGTGSLVFATSPTLVTPILGTPTSGNLTNTTGFPAANLAGTALPSAIVTSSLTALGTIATGVWNGTAIGIAYGGTGQTTASAGFNALSPITTTGDLILGNGTNSATRLAIGANTYVLTSNGTTASWVAPSGGGTQATATALGTVYAKQTTGGGTPYLTAFGYNAGVSSTGAGNTAMGTQALYTNSTGTQNAAVGYQALYNNTASYNTALGYQAGIGISSGYLNTAIGLQAMGHTAVVTGTENVGIGYYSLGNLTSGTFNMGIGDYALQTNTTGSNNTAIGGSALNSNDTASNNTAIGYQAGYTNSTGTGLSFVGAGAGYGNTTANYNTAFGESALRNTSTGKGNVALGNSALYANTTGRSNTAVGCYDDDSNPPMRFNTTGSYNIAVGTGALGANTTTSYNTAVGYQAGSKNASDFNNFFGYTAGLNTTSGGNNCFFGDRSGYTNTTGGSNTFVGTYCGQGNTTGSSNTFVGTNAGYSNTSGSNITCLGYQAVPASATDTHEIVISTLTTSGKGSSTGYINPNGGGVYQGNASTLWSTASDQRIKKNIVDNTIGLDKISQIRVRNFEYRLPEEIDTSLKPTDAVNIAGVRLGVIAQELQEILPDCVKAESTGVLTIDADNIMWHMINAIKELNAKVTALEAKLGA
jgi:hypothetical protein